MLPVVHPAIGLAKTPDVQTVLAGSTATFTIVVINTGDVALTNVTVGDALAPSCNRVIDTLAARATNSYSCSLAGVTADLRARLKTRLALT